MDRIHAQCAVHEQNQLIMQLDEVKCREASRLSLWPTRHVLDGVGVVQTKASEASPSNLHLPSRC